MITADLLQTWSTAYKASQLACKQVSEHKLDSYVYKKPQALTNTDKIKTTCNNAYAEAIIHIHTLQENQNQRNAG